MNILDIAKLILSISALILTITGMIAVIYLIIDYRKSRK